MDKDAVHTYNGIILSHENDMIFAICINTDAPIGYHAKWNKSDKGKYHMISFISGMWKKKTNGQTQHKYSHIQKTN